MHAGLVHAIDFDASKNSLGRLLLLATVADHCGRAINKLLLLYLLFGFVFLFKSRVSKIFNPTTVSISFVCVEYTICVYSDFRSDRYLNVPFSK